MNISRTNKRDVLDREYGQLLPLGSGAAYERQQRAHVQQNIAPYIKQTSDNYIYGRCNKKLIFKHRV